MQGGVGKGRGRGAREVARGQGGQEEPEEHQEELVLVDLGGPSSPTPPSPPPSLREVGHEAEWASVLGGARGGEGPLPPQDSLEEWVCEKRTQAWEKRFM